MSSQKSSHIPMPSGFLSLAPATSSSYPVSQKPRTSSSTSTASTTSSIPATLPLTTTALAQATTSAEVIAAATAAASKQRTSSHSSDGSKSSQSGLRYLKLGPVHQGAHLDGAKNDWHDIAVEE